MSESRLDRPRRVVRQKGRGSSLNDLTKPKQAPDVEQLFLQACYKGHVTTVLHFIEGGKEKARDTFEDTGLHMAAASKAPGALHVLTLLLQAGANVNARNKLMITPLHRAATEGIGEAVSLLLANGACIDARDEFGGTPLHSAVTRGHLAAVRLLVEAGADLDARNNAHCSPLISALKEGHCEVRRLGCCCHNVVIAENLKGFFNLYQVVEMLLAAGCSTAVVTSNGKTPMCIVRESPRLDAFTQKRLQALLSSGSGQPEDTPSADSLSPERSPTTVPFSSLLLKQLFGVAKGAADSKAEAASCMLAPLGSSPRHVPYST
ncbi:unnamed protein product [Chrysoparadoxa australica]